MKPSNVSVTLQGERRRYEATCTPVPPRGPGGVLLSQQVAHTQRVLLGRVRSQRVGAAGHMVLSLRRVREEEALRRFPQLKMSNYTCYEPQQPWMLPGTIYSDRRSKIFKEDGVATPPDHELTGQLQRG